MTHAISFRCWSEEQSHIPAVQQPRTEEHTGHWNPVLTQALLPPAASTQARCFAQGCSPSCSSTQLSLCHRGNRQISHRFWESYTWAPDCNSWIPCLFLPMGVLPRYFPLGHSATSSPLMSWHICCSHVKGSLKHTLWPWYRFDLSCCTQFSSSLAFLQSCPKKSTRYLFIHLQHIEWPWQWSNLSWQIQDRENKQ